MQVSSIFSYYHSVFQILRFRVVKIWDCVVNSERLDCFVKGYIGFQLCENGTAYICDSYYYVECTNTSCPSACSPCETGYACKDGIRTLCRAGTYSDGQMGRLDIFRILYFSTFHTMLI